MPVIDKLLQPLRYAVLASRRYIESVNLETRPIVIAEHSLDEVGDGVLPQVGRNVSNAKRAIRVSRLWMRGPAIAKYRLVLLAPFSMLLEPAM